MDVRSRLDRGEEVTWEFTPGERRLRIALPEELGGATRELALHGRYTFGAVGVPAAAR
jgi:hypothetical protein